MSLFVAAALVFQFLFTSPSALADTRPSGTAMDAQARQTFDFNSVLPYSGNPEGPESGGPPMFVAPSGPVAISHDLTALPAPVKRLRDDIIAAARTGNIARLGPIFARQGIPTELGPSRGQDPVVFLKENSNDGNGCETLAIMLDLLDAPYAVYNPGTPDAVYVWPAFVAEDLSKLTPEELVDVYRVVSSQDLLDMQQYGGWFFYRIGISARGEWLYFSASE